MKLIIDIDKEYYEALKRLEQKIKDRTEEGLVDKLEIAIINGTPLSEELEKLKQELEAVKQELATFKALC